MLRLLPQCTCRGRFGICACVGACCSPRLAPLGHREDPWCWRGATAASGSLSVHTHSRVCSVHCTQLAPMPCARLPVVVSCCHAPQSDSHGYVYVNVFTRTALQVGGARCPRSFWSCQWHGFQLEAVQNTVCFSVHKRCSAARYVIGSLARSYKQLRADRL